MLSINLKWLVDHSVCEEGKNWFIARYKGSINADEFIEVLIAEKQLKWTNWLLVRILDRTNCIKYAVFSAEQVLDRFELWDSKDKKPRTAIEAVQKYLLDPSEQNKVAVVKSAKAVSCYGTGHPIGSKAFASATNAVVNEVNIADAGTSYAEAYTATNSVVRKKILEYGLELLKSQ